MKLHLVRAVDLPPFVSETLKKNGCTFITLMIGRRVATLMKGQVVVAAETQPYGW
jgi:hypothetical protein